MKYECNQSNQSQWVETSVATTTKLKNVFVAITLDGLINFNYIIKQCWTNLKDRIKSFEKFPFFGDILLLRTYCMHIWNKEKKYISHQIAISCHSHQLPHPSAAISSHSHQLWPCFGVEGDWSCLFPSVIYFFPTTYHCHYHTSSIRHAWKLPRPFLAPCPAPLAPLSLWPTDSPSKQCY